MSASASPARLDTMQAAILIEKLKIFEDEIAARNKVAERYAQGLGNVVTVPRLASGCTSVWAQYTIRLPKGSDRDGFAATLKAQGIPTAIYYPKSMHQQTAYRDFPVADGGLPVSESLSARCHQPADACLSRRADAGADHQGCARRVWRMIPKGGSTRLFVKDRAQTDISTDFAVLKRRRML